MSRRTCFCCFGGTNRLSMATVTGKAANRSFRVSKCWKQRTVVGASIATCLLSETALNAARMPTSVLPYPTSPQTQAIHGHLRLHVLLDVGDCSLLIGGLFVLERFFELPLPIIVQGEGMPQGNLAFRVEPQQLVSHVPDGSLDARLARKPGRPPELVQVGLGAFRRRILLDKIQPFERYVESVPPVIVEGHASRS